MSGIEIKIFGVGSYKIETLQIRADVDLETHVSVEDLNQLNKQASLKSFFY